MTTRHTKNATTLSQKRHVRSQTKEINTVDGGVTVTEEVENNANLTGFTGNLHYYAGSDNIPVGTDQSDVTP